MKLKDLGHDTQGFLLGQKRAAEWLEALPEFQKVFAATKANLASPNPIPNSALYPNAELTQYLGKILLERIAAIADYPVLATRWKDDIGFPPDVNKFSLRFMFDIHSLVQFPIWFLLREHEEVKSLRSLRKILYPAIVKYRRWVSQYNADPILSSAEKYFLTSFCNGAIFVLDRIPKPAELSRQRLKYGVNKPLDSAPHRQRIFDEMLVSLVDYFRERSPDVDQKELAVFTHVSKILSLAWGSRLCPDKPRMWRTRYNRAKLAASTAHNKAPKKATKPYLH